jgi:enterobactin synthetase component D / holo-[acyl-carrier protein] synthase
VPSHTTSAAVSNPACVSTLIESLCPESVVAAELRRPGNPALLDPEEAQSVARAVAKRAHEFAAGRHCAHLALERLGVPPAPLRAAPDRRPLWPAGVVGSITHTRGFCAAAAARTERLIALGIDTELADAVGAELRPNICTPAELAWLDALPSAQQGSAATLIFCAKEAFYKCQYPDTFEWVSFKDVEVHPRGWGMSAGRFTLAARRPLKFFATHPALALHTAYRFHEEFVSVAVARLTL